MTDWSWGVLGSGKIEVRRVSLDLGLRTALLHYGELSVPGIGGARFVRQLLWPSLAVSLKHQGRVLKMSTARLATAIEALACKLWIDDKQEAGPDERAGRIAGIRLLPGKGWSFRELGTSQGYVTNPMRRGATRALLGLGFAEGGQRLDRMFLAKRGEDLVADVLQAKVRGALDLSGYLTQWVAGSSDDPRQQTREALLRLIGSFAPSQHERRVVRAALMRENDNGQRRRLIEALQQGELPEPLDADAVEAILQRLITEDAARMRAAWAFRRLLTAAQVAIRHIAQSLRTPGASPRLADVVGGEVGESLLAVRSRSGEFREMVGGRDWLGHSDASAFAGAIFAADDTVAAAELVVRAASLLRLDGDRLIRGPAMSERLFEAKVAHDEANDDAATDAAAPADLPPRLGGLLSLLSDCTRI
jgi:hypothetical protein